MEILGDALVLTAALGGFAAALYVVDGLFNVMAKALNRP